MWFNNIYIFKFTCEFTTPIEQLEKSLSENAFTPCGATEISRIGWSPALGRTSSAFTHQADGNILLSLFKEEKILPAPVIKDMVEEKTNTLEAEQNRSATKVERQKIKEDIIFEILPRAFSRMTNTHGYISAENNIIVINASARSKAEDFLATLRRSLGGTLPVTSLSTEKDPSDIFTQWVCEKDSESPFLPFLLGTSAKLKAIGDDAPEFQCKNQDLKSKDVINLIESGMYIHSLGLSWDECLSFKLEEDLSIKQIKFFDIITEQNDDVDSSDVLAKLDADFSLMAGEINRFILDLSKVLDFSLAFKIS